PFIDSGTDQVVAISDYFNQFESSGEDADATEAQSNNQPGESAAEQGEHDDQGGKKSDDGQNKSDENQNKDDADPAQQQTEGQNQNQDQNGKQQDENAGGKDTDTETGQQGQQTDQNPQSKNDDNKTGDNIDKATVEAVEKQLAEEQAQRNQDAYEEIMKAAEDRNIKDDITVQMDKNNQYIQITMNGALLFDSGQATIKSSVRPVLSKLGNILKIYKKNRIQILGHTDNVPISSSEFPNNLWLSMARATSIFEYMKDVKKIDATHMETTGRGEYDPIATNDTAAGRARNRRVEFRIYTNK
ncbi:MAG: OmpA family protein, partial [Eubacterium sp.]|nr:OmpA family protein [Eubacterium sp.]